MPNMLRKPIRACGRKSLPLMLRAVHRSRIRAATMALVNTPPGPAQNSPCAPYICCEANARTHVRPGAECRAPGPQRDVHFMKTPDADRQDDYNGNCYSPSAAAGYYNDSSITQYTVMGFPFAGLQKTDCSAGARVCAAGHLAKL